MKLTWKEIIKEAEANGETKYAFQAPIIPKEIKNFKYRLKIEFPEQLFSLYEEANGVIATLYDMDIGELIWPSSKVVEENLKFRRDKEMRRIYAPFDDLLFFSDSGSGDQFAFKIVSGLPCSDIYFWDHEDDHRIQIAPTLDSFIRGWISGKIVCK